MNKMNKTKLIVKKKMIWKAKRTAEVTTLKFLKSHNRHNSFTVQSFINVYITEFINIEQSNSL